MTRLKALALMLLLAVASVPTIVHAQQPAVLVVPQGGEPRTMSPNFASDSFGFAPQSNVYGTLVALDWGVIKGTSAYGDLAESWTTSDDGKTVTFKLHRNVTWHDGRPVTAHDVKFTFDMIIRKRYPAFVVLRNVSAITVPDDHTVVLTLVEPEVSFVPMLAQVSSWTAKIYPRHLWEGQDGFDTGPNVNNPIGFGPFRFVRWERGGVVELEANATYFRGRPQVDRLIFRPITDPVVARAEFDAGRIPILPFDFAPPMAEIAALQRDRNLRVVFTASHFSRDIQLNMRKAPLDNLMVRQAIAHAIDRDAMNRLAFSGLWKPAVHANVDTQGDWVNRNARFPAHNRAEAERLLDQAGLPRGAGGWRFAVSVTHPNQTDCRAMMEVLVQQLRTVGINARLEQFDQTTWFRRMGEGNFDISCYFTRYGPDPDSFREHFATGGGRNFMGFSNPEVDRIALQASTMRDNAARRPIYHRIQEIVTQQLPYINLFDEQKTTLVRQGWRGFSIEEEGFNTSMTWFGFYAVRPPGR
jgi:peptide/nickel transport system substrate-binding protein